ncbi:MAG: hypothetical protein OXF27_13530 [Acidobacteria bacterium]|nr:hypothetical protein [Acidobacteriota bacterium]
MNKDRRKRLGELNQRLDAIAADLETIRDEEQDAYDNLPEAFQDGAQGEAMQESIDAMAETQDRIEEQAGEIDQLVER